MRFRDFHPNVKVRIYVLFVFGIVQATTFPFMSIYFAKSFGERVTGGLLVICVLAGMISGTVGGYYADRIGRKKLMLLAESVFLLSYLIMAMANSPWYSSPVLTFITFFINNVCWGIYAPADQAMILDVTTSENRQLVYSIMYWAHNLTMAIGASLGAIWFESYRFELFLAMSVIMAGTLLTTYYLIEETYEPEIIHGQKTAHKGIFQNYWTILKDLPFMRYIIAGILVMSVEFQLSNYIGIRLSKELSHQSAFTFHGHSFTIDGVNMLGFLQTENTLIVVLFAALAVKLIQRFTQKWGLITGLCLYTVGYSVLMVSNSPAILFAAGAVSTFGEVLEVPVRQSFVGDLAPVHARSSYLAVNELSFTGARLMASFGVFAGFYLSSWVMSFLTFTFGMTGLWIFLSIMGHVEKRRSDTSAGAAVSL